MKIMKACLAMKDEDGKTYICDVIRWKKAYWLVPEWLDAASEGWSTPARIVLLGPLQFQQVRNCEEYQFLVNEPVPRSILEGAPTKLTQVIERPPIRFSAGRA